jgi:RimJ/RimL family protein N-acetyltransferase
MDVTLRPVVPEDLPVLYEHQADPESRAMAAFPGRDREAFMAHWEANVLGNPRGVVRAIVVDGAVVGHVVVFDAGDEREVGYWIDRAQWGRGIATAALAAFLEEITERPLFARVAAHNGGSRRVLEKCGFDVVGRDRWSLDDGTDDGPELVLRLD